MNKKKKVQKKLPTYLQERKKSNLFTFQKYKKEEGGKTKRAKHPKLIVEEENLLAQGVDITDDAMVVELLTGSQVKLVEGSYENIKITTPEDLTVAEGFLKKLNF